MGTWTAMIFSCGSANSIYQRGWRRLRTFLSPRPCYGWSRECWRYCFEDASQCGKFMGSRSRAAIRPIWLVRAGRYGRPKGDHLDISWRCSRASERRLPQKCGRAKPQWPVFSLAAPSRYPRFLRCAASSRLEFVINSREDRIAVSVVGNLIPLPESIELLPTT